MGLYKVSGQGGLRGAPMKSSVIKRSIVIGGHKTSVSLEDPFWDELKKIAHARRVTLSELVANIDGGRKQSNLSSAIRQFVLEHFQNAKKRVDEMDTQHVAISDYATTGAE
jgi:predicted DNA-binding ribbon-helix-helix protein